MNKNSALSIAIVGGGFCGMLTMVQLAKRASQSKKKIFIKIFYKGPPQFRGTAFYSYSEKHLLNVAAKNMSAFPDQPDHFIDWLSVREDFSDRSKEDIASLYLPRNLYGSYLEELMQEAITQLDPDVQCEVIHAEVIAIHPEQNCYSIHCLNGDKFTTDKVVLATGNQLPGSPLSKQQPGILSAFYYPNPWSEDCVQHLEKVNNVLIIGTGLTMIDVVLGLIEKNFDGKIICVSPKGFHILPHRIHQPYTEILDEIKAPYDLVKLFRIFRKHIRKVKAENKSGETVVDALRSKTQEIWQELNLKDKKRFMQHVRHLWGVARHRLPASIYETIQKKIQSGRLEIHAGRILDVKNNDTHATVQIQERSSHKNQSWEVQRIINCTGPESNPNKFSSALFHQLLGDKIIFVDEMQLGIKANAEGRILNEDAKASDSFFVIGSLLRGTLWETTAVPELRVQAENLSKNILQD